MLAGCDSGADGPVQDTGTPLPTPENGIQGQVIKGVISGASISITDASGAEIPLQAIATTSSNGSYSATFTEGALARGINTPVVVTASIKGATITCDLDRVDTDSDCALQNGEFAAFGATFTQPTEFFLRAIEPDMAGLAPTASNIVTVNVSPVTELVAALALTSADGSALTEEEVLLAQRQVKGLLHAMTGIDISTADLNKIPLVDLTNLPPTVQQLPDAAFVVTAFAVAMHAELRQNDPDADTLPEVLELLAADITANANGNLQGTGDALGRVATSMTTALDAINRQLAAAGAARESLLVAQQTALLVAGVYDGFGSSVISVAASTEDEDAEAPLTLTRNFVNKLTVVMRALNDATGLPGFAGTRDAALGVFSGELESIDRLTTSPVSDALEQIVSKIRFADETLADQELIDDNDIEDDGFAGNLARDTDGTRLIMNGLSIFTDPVSGDTATITIGSGRKFTDEPFESGSMTIELTDANDELIERLQGNLTLEFSESRALLSYSFSGVSRFGADGIDLEVSLTTTIAQTPEDVTTFDATWDFGSDTVPLTVQFMGDVGGSMQSFVVTTTEASVMGTSTRQSGANSDVLTDGTIYLALALNLNQNIVTSGLLSLGTGTDRVVTGSVDTDGVVRYSDGSIQPLPSPIF